MNVSIKLCATALLVVATLFALYPSANAGIRELGLPGQLRECYGRAANYTLRNYVGGLYTWYCEAPLRAQIKGTPPQLSPVQQQYVSGLYTKVAGQAGGRGKRQAGTRCIRKEYRMLTDLERTNFHAAVNALKRDTTVSPNKYDALALFHTGIATFVAHGGPGFPGWHRVYLLLFEAALQEVNPSVCVPYWDSSLDSWLPNPAQSYIWSSTFLGDGDAEVTTGPFAGWITPDGVPLRRSVGADGVLMTRANIELIMSRSTPEEILLPDQDPQYSLEFHHGGPHVFVGGDMERLDTAANDPAFFMHHAFIDYIWELFRNKIRANGVNPETYAVGASIPPLHAGTAAMGFGNITHGEGFLDALISTYEYQSSPVCSAQVPDCGSKYLWCDVAQAHCLPVDPSTIPTPTPPPTPGTPAPPTPTTGPHLPPANCPKPKPQAFQNSFCINGQCDVNQWVWLPVKIVSQRPPEFTKYQSFPVQGGKISTTNDIYEPSAYSDVSRYIVRNRPFPKSYDNCEVTDGVGKIFLTTTGVNYDGFYKESAIIDQRLATSIGITYIAVKNPAIGGTTQVMLRAHDQCGRICHTACKTGTAPSDFQPCSGVVEVNGQAPLNYGQTYAAATLLTYGYATDRMCPVLNTDNVFVTFYCDYMDTIPWVEKPATIITQTPKPTVQVPPISGRYCQLSNQCIVNQPCYKDPQGRQCSTYGESLACVGNCGRYAVCNYGTWWPRYCPAGLHFDQRLHQCVAGACQHNPAYQKPAGATVAVATAPNQYYNTLVGRFLPRG